MTRIGILALQGCIDPHVKHFLSLGVSPLPVRDASDLSNTDALVLPGGESTAMLKLLERFGLKDTLKNYSKPLWGICAGSILLASEVQAPQQFSFAKIDILTERNGYGSQQDSFHAELRWQGEPRSVDFIRAPKLKARSSKAQLLLEYNSEGVLYRQNDVLCSAFHTELGADPWLHRYFLEML